MKQKHNIFIIFLILILSISNLGAVPHPDPTIPPGFDAAWFANLVDLFNQGEILSDQLVIKIDPNSSLSAIKSCAGITSASNISSISALNIQILDIHDFQLLDVIRMILSCPGVIYAEPSYIYTIADTIPNDTFFSSDQYGLVNIRAPQGWDLSTGDNSVVIAVLDTGVDMDHPDLAGKLVTGYDFINSDTNPQDDNGHGSHVAGIAAAVSNNGIGVAGVSWGARIMPLKVLDSSGSGGSTGIAQAITWAADNGADVISMSFGSASSSQSILDAVNYAYSQGVTLVAATGNDNRELPYSQFGRTYSFYPAAYENVIAVGATDSTNTRASFSNYGNLVDVVAPGVDIISTYFNKDDPGGFYYAWASGTSMATPFVSGLAAILIGLPGSDTPAFIRQVLRDSALDLGTSGWDKYFGYGLIQVDAAIQEILPPPLPGAFGKISPTQSAVNQLTNPNLTWGSSTNAVSYEYCLDTTDDSSCDGSWISTNANKTVNVQINSNSTYYWQVRSKNSTGITYADSNQWWSFTTKSCSTLNITITPEGGGNVELTPAPDCQNGTKYSNGTNVNLNAIPASNYYRFIDWSGDTSGTNSSISLNLSTDLSVSANFEKSTFDDVPFDYSETIGGVTYYLYDYIQTLFDNKMTAGTSTNPPLYSPTQLLNRAMAAVFMLRANFGETVVLPDTYDTFTEDEWNNNAWARPWAEGMYDAKLTAGCQSPGEPLRYCPDQTLPRVQAIIFGLHMKYDYYDNGELVSWTPDPATGTVFADMTDTGFYGTAWAEAAYAAGLLPICGESGGKPLFCPNDPVNRAWAAYMIVQAKGLLVTP